MVNNDLGFSFESDIYLDCYTKNIDENTTVRVAINSGVAVIYGCYINISNMEDLMNTGKIEQYDFVFNHKPSDDDILNILRYISYYIIPHHNNPTEESKKLMADAISQLTNIKSYDLDAGDKYTRFMIDAISGK